MPQRRDDLLVRVAGSVGAQLDLFGHRRARPARRRAARVLGDKAEALDNAANSSSNAALPITTRNHQAAVAADRHDRRARTAAPPASRSPVPDDIAGSFELVDQLAEPSQATAVGAQVESDPRQGTSISIVFVAVMAGLPSARRGRAGRGAPGR